MDFAIPRWMTYFLVSQHALIKITLFFNKLRPHVDHLELHSKLLHNLVLRQSQRRDSGLSPNTVTDLCHASLLLQLTLNVTESIVKEGQDLVDCITFNWFICLSVRSLQELFPWQTRGHTPTAPSSSSVQLKPNGKHFVKLSNQSQHGYHLSSPADVTFSLRFQQARRETRGVRAGEGRYGRGHSDGILWFTRWWRDQKNCHHWLWGNQITPTIAHRLLCGDSLCRHLVIYFICPPVFMTLSRSSSHRWSCSSLKSDISTSAVDYVLKSSVMKFVLHWGLLVERLGVHFYLSSRWSLVFLSFNLTQKVVIVQLLSIYCEINEHFQILQALVLVQDICSHVPPTLLVLSFLEMIQEAFFRQRLSSTTDFLSIGVRMWHHVTSTYSIAESMAWKQQTDERAVGYSLIGHRRFNLVEPYRKLKMSLSLYVGCASFTASLFETQRRREREKKARTCLKARDWVVLLIELILYESK